MLILKGFAVAEEAAAGVEVDCARVPLLDRSRSGWDGLRGVDGLRSWRNRWSGVGCGKGVGHVGG